MASRFEYISKTATASAASWTNHEIAAFHYFNPNGLMHAKEALDQLISRAVDDGKCKSGAIIAYGTLNYYYTDRLRALYDQKRANGIELSVTLDGLRRDIATARQFLATLES